jgi:hypothetical protein
MTLAGSVQRHSPYLAGGGNRPGGAGVRLRQAGMPRARAAGADFHQDGILIMSQDATRSAGMWIAIGIAIGAAIGTTMDNLAMGVGIGIAIGAAMWGAASSWGSDQQQPTEPDSESSRPV